MPIGQIRAVIRRELGERMTRPGYWITTVLGILVMIAFVVVPSLIIKASHPGLTVGSLNVPAKVLSGAAPTGISVSVKHVASMAQGTNLVRQHNLAGFFREVSGRLLFYGQVNGSISALIANLNHQALVRALPMPLLMTLAHAQARFGVKIVPVSTGAALIVRRLAVYALDVIMMVVVTTYGVFIGMSVVEEKESRHAEILMAWIRPRPLLFGKIAGFAIMAFIQVTLWSVAGVIALLIKSPHGLSVEGFSISFVLLFLLWVVIGYLQYSTAFAALASRAQRTSEMNQAVLPITLLVFIGYLGAVVALSHPTGILVPVLRVASFVPFLAPMLSLALLQVGNVSWWQVVADAVFQLVVWGILLQSAAGLFQRHLLNYRQVNSRRRPRWRLGRP